MFVAPALFASNMLMARATADVVPPVALAVGRWALAFLFLLPLVARPLWLRRDALRREWLDLAVLGALGMGVCGAIVYLGAATTTATNIGIIYAASPVIIILLAHLVYGEAMSARQGVGVALALVGVVAIVARGDIDVLLGLQFTSGDLYIVTAAISWAIYSVMIQHRRSVLPVTVRFAAISAAGVITMLPFLAIELWIGRVPAFDAPTIGAMVFLALVPGVGAYQIYTLIQRALGANRTSLLMYTIPLYNAVLAWALLGETLQVYHLVGGAMVLPGIYLATRRDVA